MRLNLKLFIARLDYIYKIYYVFLKSTITISWKFDTVEIFPNPDEQR